MSACNDFVEHIWKPGSCKNCFCLRSDHQLLPARPQPRAGGLPPPPRLPPRPEDCRLEDEGVNSSPYSKPTIAVKPTMLSSDASDTWSEANVSGDTAQVAWRRPSGKLPCLKQGDEPMLYLDNFPGFPKPALPPTPTEGHPRCSPAFTTVRLHSTEFPGERNTTFHPLNFPKEKAGQEEKPMFPYQELPSTQESIHQKQAAFGRMTAGCHKGPGLCPSPQPPRESPPLEDDGDQRCSPSGDSEGGEYCSILDCCPLSPAAQDTSQAQGTLCRTGSRDCFPTGWEQGVCSRPAEEMKRVLSSPRECRSQGPAENPPTRGPRQLSPPSEAGSSSEGLSLGSASSRTSSPFPSPLESDYCSLVKEPVQGKQQDSGCHAVTSSRYLGPTEEPQPPARARDVAQPEPIYAESTKRKKAVPVPSRPQAKAQQAAAAPSQGHSHGQVRTTNAWAQKTASGWGLNREGLDTAPQVAATLTVLATHPKEDHRTIYLSSPDSSVGVQWPCQPAGRDSEAGDEETSARQGLSPREGRRRDVSENLSNGKPAIPPKLSRSSPGGSPVSLSASPLSDLSEGSSGSGIGPQPSSRCPADPACWANGIANHDSVKCPPPAPASSTVDQRRPRYQTGAWSRQCRIEEEEEVEQDLLSQSWGGETGNGTADSSSSSTWHRLCPPDGTSGQNNKPGTGMSKSASFAFEFPKDRSRPDAFSPPPPPPKSRHLLKMNKSSSDLEKVSQGSAESLSPSFRSAHASFTTGSTDSLASDSRTCSDGGPSSEPAHSPPSSGKKLFVPVPFPSGSTEDVSPGSPLQPPPLPQKKLVSRAASSPDGFFWPLGSKSRTASPKLNLSHSEINVCARAESHFSFSSSPGHRHPHPFSSAELLDKTFRSNDHWAAAPGPAGSRSGSGSPSLQGRGVPSASSSQLSVASQASAGSTPLHLHSLLSSISSKEGTYAKLVGLNAQSLVRLMAKCEDLFMGGQKKELHFDENNWSLFKLTCNKPCCDSGDAIYYCATCSEDPGSTYAVKICKTPEPKTASYCSPSVPVHFNVQQDCGHFVASVPSSMLTPPAGPKDPPPAQEQDCVVVITREVPHQTASDFVRDSAHSHQAEPEAYERRVCFLLLQLCNGLEHLKEHGVVHGDLCLENLLLVHCAPGPSPAASGGPVSTAASSTPSSTTAPAPAAAAAPGPSASLPASATPSPLTAPTCHGAPTEKHLPRLIISNFLKAKQKPGGTANLQQIKSEARLAPEIVSASQYSKSDEFQAGILIYELLHQPNPFEVRAQLRAQMREQGYRQEDLPPLPTLSLYSRGLQQLAHLLLEADPSKRIRICEARRVLQCLLWGPRRDLVEQRGASEEALGSRLHNWIDLKRALMMMKFAEKALDCRRGVELEDWLCCQYLASAEPAALLQSLKLLQLL